MQRESAELTNVMHISPHLWAIEHLVNIWDKIGLVITVLLYDSTLYCIYQNDIEVNGRGVVAILAILITERLIKWHGLIVGAVDIYAGSNIAH